ncbi:protein phosphatase [Cyanobium sp. FGCU-6]|nr:protein phosphatase [Cyanobium sp. FGCU6]
MDKPPVAALQATLIDFAIAELVRQHRDSFPPVWTVESWAKLLIWLALNCGCSGDPAALEAFAAALGPVLTGRMRRTFFERELVDLDLQVMADPAERQVLVLPLGPAAGALDPERVASALKRVGLLERLVADRTRWQALEAVTAVPWSEPCA